MGNRFRFRAWDKADKVMCDVAYIKFSKVQYMNVGYRKNIHGKIIDVNALLDENLFGTCVLMQYTNVTDDNGVLVFEGDYLSDGRTIWRVEYDQTMSGFCAKAVGGYIPSDCKIFSLYHLCTGHNEKRRISVVGNMYEYTGALSELLMC